MLDKLKKYIKNQKKQFKKLKKRIENKDKIIQEQAEDIHYLILEQDKYKNKCIEFERKNNELKNKINFLAKRDSKLQEIEQLFLEEEINLSKLSRIVIKTRVKKCNVKKEFNNCIYNNH